VVAGSVVAGGIDEGDFLGLAAANVENEAVQKKMVRIGEEARAQHAGRDCSGRVNFWKGRVEVSSTA
jgi:hypothetical protein